MNRFKWSSSGFTLLELILVAAIFGIFAAGALSAINPRSQIEKANDARRKSDLAEIQKSLESYFQDNGRYPPFFPSDYTLNPSGRILWGTAWKPYMNIVPKDPSVNRRYVYYSSNDGQTYLLYASLERGTKDPNACKGEYGCPSLQSFGIPLKSCGETCNYGVSSSNVNP